MTREVSRPVYSRIFTVSFGAEGVTTKPDPTLPRSALAIYAMTATLRAWAPKSNTFGSESSFSIDNYLSFDGEASVSRLITDRKSNPHQMSAAAA